MGRKFFLEFPPFWNFVLKVFVRPAHRSTEWCDLYLLRLNAFIYKHMAASNFRFRFLFTTRQEKQTLQKINLCNKLYYPRPTLYSIYFNDLYWIMFYPSDKLRTQLKNQVFRVKGQATFIRASFLAFEKRPRGGVHDKTFSSQTPFAILIILQQLNVNNLQCEVNLTANRQIQ